MDCLSCIFFTFAFLCDYSSSAFSYSKDSLPNFSLTLFFDPSILLSFHLGNIMSVMDEARYVEGGYKVVIVAVILLFMQSLLVTGRCYSRRMQKIMLEADDYVLLLATVSSSRPWLALILTPSSSLHPRCVLLQSRVSVHSSRSMTSVKIRMLTVRSPKNSSCWHTTGFRKTRYSRRA